MKKLAVDRPFAAAARKIVEIANGVEAMQDGRIYIERVNDLFYSLVVVVSNSAPVSSAPLRSAGSSCTRVART